MLTLATNRDHGIRFEPLGEEDGRKEGKRISPEANVLTDKDNICN
jgi:hypothetical protein